ncbi:MAG TPA: cupin domain-containing protein, partial [Methylomirabilota bacterium]|nr:cupin domain-containing protein [Methylomirabilota bacterium]
SLRSNASEGPPVCREQRWRVLPFDRTGGLSASDPRRYSAFIFGLGLIVTFGVGWTQEWGGPVVELRAGDVVWCPPGVKHWHGATPTTGMTHIALTGTVGGKNVDWLEKVSDEQYGKR